MKKKYTKKQIQESIRYWQKRLNHMNESIDSASSLVIMFQKDGLTNYDYQSYARFNDDDGIPVHISNLNDDLYDMVVNCKTKVEAEFKKNGFDVTVVAMEYESGPKTWSINIKCNKTCDRAAMDDFLNYMQEVYT